MDNIYVLIYLITREVGKKKGRMVVLFINLKAAFDSLDRRILINTMNERRIREGLIERVEKVLRETNCRVKVRGEMGKTFLDRKRGKAGVFTKSFTL